MHKGFFAVGILVAVVGGLMLLAAASGADGANVAVSHSIPAYPGDLQLQINSIGSASVAVSWSGGSSSTQVYLAPCASGGCQHAGAPLQIGHGSSGSFSASVTPGTYLLWENFTAGSVSGSYTVSGLTLLLLLGGVLLAAGAALIVVGVVKKSKPKVAYEEEEEQKFKIGPMERGAEEMGAPAAPAPVAAKPAAAAAAVNYRPPPPEPPRFMKASEPYTPSSGSPTAGSERPQRVCPSCGTTNEPWITNCRNCKRPLSTTG